MSNTAAKMRKRLEHQADQIETVLTRHLVPCRVEGGTVTPRAIRFQVLPKKKQLAAIQELAGELAIALGTPSLRIARRGASVQIELPREEPQTVKLLPLLQGLREVPAMTAALGLADDGAPLLIRLPSPDVSHILVAGATGAGKTSLLRSMAISLVHRHPRKRELVLILVDLQDQAFGDMAALPHLSRPVVVRREEAVEVLGSLVRLMEQRDRLDERTPSVVVFVDELADVVRVAEERFTHLLQRGRETGIHLVAATREPTAPAIQRMVKEGFPVRVVGKMVSAQDALTASGWRGTGAERLLGPGEFIAVAEGRLHRFYAAYVGPEGIAQIVESTQKGALALTPKHSHPQLRPVCAAQE